MFKISQTNKTETRAITRRHHSYHPLLGQSSFQRRNGSSSIAKPQTVIRHNVSSSSQWLFRSRTSSLAVGRISNSSVLRIYPTNQGSEKNNFLSRTSVLSGTETMTGSDVQNSFRMPASIAAVTIAVIFFTLTLTSTLILGILCRREKKMKIKFCSDGVPASTTSSQRPTSSSPSSSSSSSADVTSPSSVPGVCKETSGGNEGRFGGGGGGGDEDRDGGVYLHFGENCPLHVDSYTTLDSQGLFYWFQDGDSLHDDEQDYSCYGSYPFLATYVSELRGSATLPSVDDHVHYCNASNGQRPHFRLSEMNRTSKVLESETEKMENESVKANFHDSTSTLGRAGVEHSCSLDELAVKKSKRRASKRRFYERFRGKARDSIKKGFASTASYSEIPSRQTDDSSYEWSRGDALISRESFETVSTRVSHRSVTKSENEDRLDSSLPFSDESETRVNPEVAASSADVHSCDETEAMLPTGF